VDLLRRSKQEKELSDVFRTTPFSIFHDDTDETKKERSEGKKEERISLEQHTCIFHA